EAIERVDDEDGWQFETEFAWLEAKTSADFHLLRLAGCAIDAPGRVVAHALGLSIQGSSLSLQCIKLLPRLYSH
ncbi:MAG: hypothetical protein P8173_16065, partial [Gammaproteobacteria bacterium]